MSTSTFVLWVNDCCSVSTSSVSGSASTACFVFPVLHELNAQQVFDEIISWTSRVLLAISVGA